MASLILLTIESCGLSHFLKNIIMWPLSFSKNRIMRHLSFSKNLMMWPLSFSKNIIMRPSTEGQFLKTKSQKVAYFDRQISKFFCVWFIWDNSRSKLKQIRICVIDSLLNNFVDNKVEKSNKKCENYLDIIWIFYKKSLHKSGQRP